MINQLDASKLKITPIKHKSAPLPKEKLKFGKTFTDHMLIIEWSAANGWDAPEIKPLSSLSLHPSCSALQYAFALFEGMKAYKRADGKIVLFRPDKNMERMNKSAERICLPSFDPDELITLIGRLIEQDKHLIPSGAGYSLYLRPTMISTTSGLGIGVPDRALIYVIASPVGPYFSSGFKPIRLEATDYATRSWPGGVGDKKVAGNYAPCVLPQREACARGFHQNLWLFGPKNYITEVGTMNVFFVFFDSSTGKKELVTAPLDGTILEGITRDSILSLTSSRLDSEKWKISERYFSIDEVADRAEKGEVLEAFGAGTAAIVVPIHQVGWRGKIISIPLGQLTEDIAKWVSDIQYGVDQTKDWCRIVAELKN